MPELHGQRNALEIERCCPALHPLRIPPCGTDQGLPTASADLTQGRSAAKPQPMLTTDCMDDTDMKNLCHPGHPWLTCGSAALRRSSPYASGFKKRNTKRPGGSGEGRRDGDFVTNVARAG